MFRRRAPAALPPFPPGAVLVGGAVRDRLLGHLPRDFDWVCADPGAAARAWAQDWTPGGTVFALDPERGHYRVLRGDETHDFAPLGPDLTANLAARDFTVNALALHPDGRLSDPFGGRRDLRRRRLHPVSPGAVAADGVRALRGVRLAACLGLRPSREAQAQLRAFAAAPTPQAPERVLAELDALLGCKSAADGVAELHRLGLLALYLPELAAGDGVQQGGYHHLDVLGHSVEALRRLLLLHPAASLTLRWATLLHDIGKPPCATADPERGYTRFFGHDELGAELAARRLRALRAPGERVRGVAALVRYHMLPLPPSERAARRFVGKRRELLPELLWLMLADREAARGPLSSPGSRLAYQRGMDRVLAALEGQPEPPRPLLTGREIMQLLALPPGPAVGQAVRELEGAQAVGDVQDEAGARLYLLNWWDKQKPSPTGREGGNPTLRDLP